MTLEKGGAGQDRAALALSGWGYGPDNWGSEHGSEGQAGAAQSTQGPQVLSED